VTFYGISTFILRNIYCTLIEWRVYSWL